MKRTTLNILLIAALIGAFLLPLQSAGAASALTISMSPLNSPMHGFQTAVLYGGKKIQFGVTVISVTASINGVYANSSVDPFGKIIIAGSSKGSYCASMSVRYTFASIRLTGTKRVCHTY
jgi:hypothetical protein